MTVANFRERCNEKGYSLPDSYVRALGEGQLGRVRHPATGEVVWQILDLSMSGLAEVQQIGEMNVEFWELPSALASMFAELEIVRLLGHPPLSVDEFRRGFVFGKSGGDYLFLLPCGSIWCLWHEGYEVLKLAESWDDWRKEVTARVESESTDLGVNASLVGTWKPVSSKSAPADIFELICPMLELNKTGRAAERYSDGSVTVSSWQVKGDILLLGDAEGFAEYRYILEGDELDLTALIGDFHCRYAQF